MKRLVILFKIMAMGVLISSIAHAAITITNLGDGTGKIYWRAISDGIILETCNLSATPGACNVGVTQATSNGHVIEAEALSGSYFAGWSGDSGTVSSCSDSTRTCNITGSAAGAVNATFTSCTSTISPANETIPWSGGSGNITVTAAHSSCNWTATETLEWISIPSGSSGTGNGTVKYSVSANNRSTSTRAGTISAGGNNFTITQQGYIGKIKVDPDPMDFGTVRVGVASQLNLKISNVGTTTLDINSIVLTGTNIAEFSKVKSCSAIDGGSFCSIDVLLKPQSAGYKTATLRINSDDPAYPLYDVTLSGTASTTASANISVSPSNITIPNLDMEIADTRTVRIRNSGTGSLIIHSINIRGINSAEFSVNNDCSVINPDGYCDFSVTGSYLSNNSKQAFVVISSNDTNVPKLEIPVTASSSLCSGSMTLSNSSTTALYEGSSGTIDITKTGESACGWLATSRNAWIAVNKGMNSMNYTVANNTENVLRMGTVTVAGRSFAVIQYGNANNTTFDDIQGNLFSDYINAIYTQSITVGCVSNISYCPKNSVTRGQMAAFIVRALYGEEFNYTENPYFSDVPSDHVFFKYVQKLRDENITTISGSYGESSYVTRGQMAAFIIRALYGEAFSYAQNPYFSDVPSDHVFFKYVQKMKDTSITTVSTIYDVDSYVTREQMAAFLARAFLGME